MTEPVLQSEKTTPLTKALSFLKSNALVETASITSISEDRPSLQVGPLSSGRVTKKWASEGGGFPRGALTEVYGGKPDSRRQAAIQSANMCEEHGSKVVYIDFSGAVLDGQLRQGCALIRPSSWEEGAEAARLQAAEGADLIIMDAPNALAGPAPEDQSLLSQNTTRFLSKMRVVLRNTPTVLVYVHDNKSSGGAVPHFASLRIAHS